MPKRLTIKEAEARCPDMVKGQTWKNVRARYWFKCKKHGKYLQLYGVHRQDKGCQKCGLLTKPGAPSLGIREAEKRFPDIVKGQVWKNARSCYKFKCKKHGEYLQTYDTHQGGGGCRKCGYEVVAETRRLGIKQARQRFPEMVKGQTWTNSSAKYMFACEKHGQYLQIFSDHQAGKGCPRCRESRMEKETSRVLGNLGIPFNREKRFDACRSSRPLPFDFSVTEEKILIECQGQQHFQPLGTWRGRERFKQQQHNDGIKRRWAKANGYELIIVRYDENVEEILTARFGVPLRKAA